ncbi:hypothetical protein D3C76_1141300 [compost metagenome]
MHFHRGGGVHQQQSYAVFHHAAFKHPQRGRIDREILAVVTAQQQRPDHLVLDAVALGNGQESMQGFLSCIAYPCVRTFELFTNIGGSLLRTRVSHHESLLFADRNSLIQN